MADIDIDKASRAWNLVSKDLASLGTFEQKQKYITTKQNSQFSSHQSETSRKKKIDQLKHSCIKRQAK